MRRTILLTATLISQTALAGSATSSWCGSGFSNPAESLQMPPNWGQLKMAYPKGTEDADLVISFGQQTFPALKHLVAEYAQKHKLKIEVQSGTCGISAGKLLRKNIDSGAFCCPPGKSDRLPGLSFHTIAISPLSVIVHKDNPLQALSTDQARMVFRGKIRHWKELPNNSANNKAITTVGRLHCKLRPGHWTLMLKNQELFSPKLKEVGVIPDLIAKVGQMNDAISIETPFMVQEYDKTRTVKQLKLDGHAPSETEYVASGRYPFYRTYSLTSWSKDGRENLTLGLIRYLQQHIEEHYADYGFVPVSMLHRYGWKFRGDELIGEPSGSPLAKAPL